jgi:DNA-directed RNA polymerase subunit RPC12/RpoP
MTAYTFRISLDCPHCRSGVPVNAITGEVLCNNCMRSIELDQTWWESHLSAETIEEAMSCEPGTGNSSQSLGGMNEKVDSGNRPPRCQHCKAEFEGALLQSAVENGGFACPGCQKRIRVRKATPLALALIHEADLLVHEDESGGDLGGDGNTGAEPVLFACLACGAGLPVDGSTRMPQCKHCGNSNYLPDPLWMRLHPAVVSHAFFVTRNTQAKPPKVAPDKLSDDMDNDKAIRILRDKDLEISVLTRLFEIFEDDSDVLEAIVKHPQTSEELMQKLAHVDHYEVRVALAKRPQISDSLFGKLAQDTDSDVKEALLKREDFWQRPSAAVEDALRELDLDELGNVIMNPKFPETRLYDLADYCTPENARRILKAPNISSRVLRRLGSNPDNRPFIKEHPLYKEMGWLKKLFFFG